jgi:hypothetical protein
MKQLKVFGVPRLRGNAQDLPKPPEGGTPNRNCVKMHPLLA